MSGLIWTPGVALSFTDISALLKLPNTLNGICCRGFLNECTQCILGNVPIDFNRGGNKIDKECKSLLDNTTTFNHALNFSIDWEI